MERLLESIQSLSILDGTSGDEEKVRAAILEKISGQYDSVQTDALGNLIVFKKGKQEPKHPILAEAHMDEVGLMVTEVLSNGMLAFTPVGGLDPRALLGKRVRFQNGARGVIGVEAIHDAKDRFAIPKMEALRIDLGASGQESASTLVRAGDTAVFDSPFVFFGDGCIKGKALDDRVGCAILIELILGGGLFYDTYFAFHVQEEVGCRGAKTGAYQVNPAIALVVEATTAADIAGVPTEKTVCTLGKGAVLSMMDGGTVYDRELVAKALSLADERGIPVQIKRMASGGNDASVIHSSREGVRTLAVSLPTRYIHSQSCVGKVADVKACLDLSRVFLQKAGDFLA